MPRFALLLALIATSAAPAAAHAQVKATLETARLYDDDAGLDVYDLQGRTVQSIPARPGRFNNVDVLTGVKLGGKVRDLAVASDRGLDKLRIFAIGVGAVPLTDVTVAGAPLVFSSTPEEVKTQATAYGLAAYVDHGDGYIAVSRSEECVPGSDPGFGGKHVAADIEGLTLWRIPFVRDVLLVSSQGDSRFVAYADGGLGRFLERSSTNFKYTRLERVALTLLLSPR